MDTDSNILEYECKTDTLDSDFNSDIYLIYSLRPKIQVILGILGQLNKKVK
jgi:hypothetical protein